MIDEIPEYGSPYTSLVGSFAFGEFAKAYGESPVTIGILSRYWKPNGCSHARLFRHACSDYLVGEMIAADPRPYVVYEKTERGGAA